MQIAGKRIVLTGAASGIGRALLEKLARYPVQVLAADRDQAGLDALAVTGPAQIRTFSGDLGQPLVVDALFAEASQSMGGIDLFIANAGIPYYEQIDQPDWDHIERIFRINVFSPIYAAEKMRALHGGRPYKVVITASAMGQLGLAGYALYGSTKAALHRFAESYRYELGDPRSLALVYPIGTRTAFFGAAAVRPAPQPWPTQTPEHVAQAMVRGIERDQLAIYPSLFFRLFMALPWLPLVEQALEAWRFRRWLKG